MRYALAVVVMLTAGSASAAQWSQHPDLSREQVPMAANPAEGPSCDRTCLLYTSDAADDTP